MRRLSGVLFLTDHLTLRGGAGQHLLQVVAAAVEAGLRATVACGRRDADVGLPAGVQVRQVRGLATQVASGRGLARLPELVDGHEIVHLQNVMNPEALSLATSCGRAVVTVQDHRVFCPGPGKTRPDGSRCRLPMGDAACRTCLPDDLYRDRLLALTERRREALEGARLVVLSRYMAEELASAGLPGAVVIPPWVDPSPPRRDAGRGLVLGGRLVRHKGVLDGWRAWRLAGGEHPLVVPGAGPLADRLEGATRPGWLGASDLRRLLRTARALLFPACWQEPFGILGVEALAAGLPVVVADVGGTSEWSDEGCLRVPAGDVESLAGAVRRLVDDPEEALRLGEAGRRMVAGRFARERLEPRLWQAYRAVSDRPRPCSPPRSRGR